MKGQKIVSTGNIDIPPQNEAWMSGCPLGMMLAVEVGDVVEVTHRTKKTEYYVDGKFCYELGGSRCRMALVRTDLKEGQDPRAKGNHLILTCIGSIERLKNVLYEQNWRPWTHWKKRAIKSLDKKV